MRLLLLRHILRARRADVRWQGADQSVETRSADWAVLVEAARVMKLEQEFVRADGLPADVSRIPRALQARTQQG